MLKAVDAHPRPLAHHRSIQSVTGRRPEGDDAATRVRRLNGRTGGSRTVRLLNEPPSASALTPVRRTALPEAA